MCVYLKTVYRCFICDKVISEGQPELGSSCDVANKRFGKVPCAPNEHNVLVAIATVDPEMCPICSVLLTIKVD